MGRYIDYNELLIRYPLVKTWSDQPSHVDSYLIYYAENRVDMLMAPAYTTPFSAGHPTVKDLSFEMCLYMITLEKDPEKAKSIYDIITDQVDKLLSGEAQVITGSGTLAPDAPGAAIWSNTKDYLPTHTMLDDDSPYTHVDSSQLYNLENERM